MPDRKMVIHREKDQLIATVSPNETFPLLFQPDTKFQFKGLVDAKCEFTLENGSVVKFTVSQNGNYEWIRVQ